MVLAGAQGGQKVFRLVVPQSRAYRFQIDTELQVTDDSGKPVEVTGPTNLQVNTTGRDQVSVTLNVR